MRLVFLGTPAFAVPTLEAIVRGRARGGGGGHAAGPARAAAARMPAASPVKEAALRLGLAGLPAGAGAPAGSASSTCARMAPDAMVVVGYGQIIPQSVIDLPPLGIINVHASLLPKYRGAGPIQWAIANGETRTGVTTMRIDAGLDTGDMLLEGGDGDRPGGERRRTGRAPGGDGRGPAGGDAGRPGGRNDRARRSRTPRRPRYAPLLKKEDGQIDWTQPARGDPQSRARPAALARRAHHFPRPAAAHLEVARRRTPAQAQPGNGRARASAAGGVRRRRARIARGPAGRPQADAGRRFRQRPALDRE